MNNIFDALDEIRQPLVDLLDGRQDSDMDRDVSQQLEALLEDLPNKIIEIHLYEFGRDVLQTDRSL